MDINNGFTILCINKAHQHWCTEQSSSIPNVLTASLLLIFSSKSLIPIIPLRHRAWQPTKPIWQSKKGSPIIRTYWEKSDMMKNAMLLDIKKIK